jgi:hypothetical protein
MFSTFTLQTSDESGEDMVLVAWVVNWNRPGGRLSPEGQYFTGCTYQEREPVANHLTWTISLEGADQAFNDPLQEREAVTKHRPWAKPRLKISVIPFQVRYRRHHQSRER